jgi:hypothetical protein
MFGRMVMEGSSCDSLGSGMEHQRTSTRLWHLSSRRSRLVTKSPRRPTAGLTNSCSWLGHHSVPPHPNLYVLWIRCVCPCLSFSQTDTFYAKSIMTKGPSSLAALQSWAAYLYSSTSRSNTGWFIGFDCMSSSSRN